MKLPPLQGVKDGEALAERKGPMVMAEACAVGRGGGLCRCGRSSKGRD